MIHYNNGTVPIKQHKVWTCCASFFSPPHVNYSFPSCFGESGFPEILDFELKSKVVVFVNNYTIMYKLGVDPSQ